MRHLALTLLSLALLTGCGQKSNTTTQSDVKDTTPAPLPELKPGEAVATFAGGCFWCIEEEFEQLKGVREVISGYAGGDLENPTYEQVGTDQTGHAEAVQIYYDPKVIPYDTLLTAFFAGHDPTTPDRQGPDIGKQYRSMAFYRTPDEKARIEATIGRVNASGHFDNPVVTQVVPFKAFYAAEVYHQGYYRAHPENPYVENVSKPKVEKFQKAMKAWLKEGL
ncbi:peptide-methionine (S)-S-oxide reductase MsrA [Rudanella lutea]|uniref:peptide-methionine (S)-S-oxide reductase MsrA n=1 Tax=Rudanella lutea TaxID=451374 RepID=UPI000379747D|nr:peptide-methionine (S)-S-oxide reductase MsrA [Rudanella lutea]